MNDLNSIANQRVSDLMDGWVPNAEDRPALDVLLSDQQSVQTWHAHHVVGDVLRSAELAPSSSDLAFWERLEQKLAHEPARPVVLAMDSEPVKIGTESANASVFRWKMLSGLACTALVGVVVLGQWTKTGPQDFPMASQTPSMPVDAPPIVTADTRVGPMMRDARLDELMAAHRQLGGHSALQVPAGFLRNATYEGPAR